MNNLKGKTRDTECNDCNINIKVRANGPKLRYCDKCRKKRALAASRRRNQGERVRIKKAKQHRGPIKKHCPCCKEPKKKSQFVPHEGQLICGDCYRSDTDKTDYVDKMKERYNPAKSHVGSSLSTFE